MNWKQSFDSHMKTLEMRANESTRPWRGFKAPRKGMGERIKLTHIEEVLTDLGMKATPVKMVIDYGGGFTRGLLLSKLCNA